MYFSLLVYFIIFYVSHLELVKRIVFVIRSITSTHPGWDLFCYIRHGYLQCFRVQRSPPSR